MKKSDIKVGAEYAQRRGQYGSAQRVRILGEARVQQGWGYGRKTITGSRAIVLDSDTGQPQTRLNAETGEQVDRIIEVANREIVEPWVDYAERNAALAKSRRDQARKLRDDRAARAEVLLDLIPALRHAGFEDEARPVRDSKILAPLEASVPDCLEERDAVFGAGKDVNLVAPKAHALVEYVTNGAAVGIKAPDLLRLLQRGNVR